ncbi:MAG: putative Ig domain-containing protein [Planctomycetota bacterium]
MIAKLTLALFAALTLTACDSSSTTTTTGGTTSPTITTAPSTAPAGTVDSAFNFELEVTGGGTMAFAVVAGSLPAGLALNAATGQISGTPTESGNFSVWIEVSNEIGAHQQNFLLVIDRLAVAPTITTTMLPDATVGLAYEQTLAVTGDGPFTWSIQTGTLPNGLSLGPTTGTIAGTPTTDGSSDVTFLVTGLAGVDTQVITLDTLPAPTAPSVTSPAGALPGATTFSGYDETMTATGTAPITWGIPTGTLPTGLVLDETTGRISGVPTVGGSFAFTVEATNAAGSDQEATSIDVVATPLINTIAPVTAPTGSTVTIQGAGFDTTPAMNTVEFGTTAATVLTATTSTLTVEVPAGLSGIQTVSVTVNAVDGLSTADFTPSSTVVHFVDAAAAGADDGSSWTDAYTEIESALAAASTGEEVWVVAGTYAPGTSTTDTYTIPTGVSVFGGFDGTEGSASTRDPLSNRTVLEGDVNSDDSSFTNLTDNIETLVTLGDDTTLSGFTVQHASESALGAALSSNLTVTLTNLIFFENHSSSNEGVLNFAQQDQIVLHDCVFDTNIADGSFGCLRLHQVADVDIARCVFVGNSASGTGVAVIDDCTAEVRDCVFANNSDDGLVGVLWIEEDGPVTVSNNTFYENSTNTGLCSDILIGSSVADMQVTIENCIQRSSDTADRTHVYVGAANVTIANCNIDGVLSRVTNDGIGTITNGGGNFDSDPLFIDVADLDGLDDLWATSDDGLALDTLSPCINAGRAPTTSTTDVLGNSRTIDGTADVGAYERSGS